MTKTEKQPIKSNKASAYGSIAQSIMNYKLLGRKINVYNCVLKPFKMHRETPIYANDDILRSYYNNTDFIVTFDVISYRMDEITTIIDKIKRKVPHSMVTNESTIMRDGFICFKKKIPPTDYIVNLINKHADGTQFEHSDAHGLSNDAVEKYRMLSPAFNEQCK